MASAKADLIGVEHLCSGEGVALGEAHGRVRQRRRRLQRLRVKCHSQARADCLHCVLTEKRHPCRATQPVDSIGHQLQLFGKVLYCSQLHHTLEATLSDGACDKGYRGRKATWE